MLRYYSIAMLGCIHRVIAIREWTRWQETEELSLERALAAFDMFVLHDRKGDFEEVSSSPTVIIGLTIQTSTRLDQIAGAIRDGLPGFAQMTTRHKALAIVKHIREKNLTGISHDEEEHYHDLQNNFIGIALRDSSHPSLPLISTAIFCCVAGRLGLAARACGFPFHVVAIVQPPGGMDLDGTLLSAGQSADSMYLDPFRSDGEIPVADLISRLRLVGASESSHTALLESSSVPETVLRTARNIMASVQEAHRRAMARHAGHEHVLLVSSFPDLEGAFYGALWASLLLGTPTDGGGPAIASTRRRNYLPPFVEHFETHFPMDAPLIEEKIVPLFQGLAEYAQLRDSIRVMRSVDSMPKQVKRRSGEISQRVQHKIGQVFKHRRYNYLAVITGWDVECGADEHWMAQMRIHELARGKHQSFYHVLLVQPPFRWKASNVPRVEDKSVRYVAEENIAIIWPEFPSRLMSLAGRHFKRWDRSDRRFVSNIKDEYPDD